MLEIKIVVLSEEISIIILGSKDEHNDLCNSRIVDLEMVVLEAMI
jgi:hypothetical protein